MNETPRLRMFAGPNGSGKTTVKSSLVRPPDWFGIYINPDDLEAEIVRTGSLNVAPYAFDRTAEELQEYFATSRLLADRKQIPISLVIARQGDRLTFGGIEFNSYHASVLADFLRREALAAQRSFSFETVMPSPDKVDLLREAQSRGFRTYLYFIAPEDPEINIRRVRNRVADGGHDVPPEKIRTRYHRSIPLASDALMHANRAFFFDTSGSEASYFAEAEEGSSLTLKTDEMPRWFRPIWDRFAGTDQS